MKQALSTDQAPAALGPYSQAIRTGSLVFLSGQIGLDPSTGALAEGFEAQVHQAFRNLSAVAKASGATLDDAVKLTLFLTDLGHFAQVNAIMESLFKAPYPARSTIGVASLPRGALFEAEAVIAAPA
jgi:reactive intermediate/imine deaminase